MTKENKPGFIHSLLFNLITKRYIKKKKQTTSVLEKNAKEEFPLRSLFGNLTPTFIITFILVGIVGFWLMGVFGDAVEKTYPQNSTSAYPGESLNSTAAEAVFEMTNTMTSIFPIFMVIAFLMIAAGMIIPIFNGAREI